MQFSLQMKHLESVAELETSFALMKELRPHLDDPVAYAEAVERQRAQGYRLLAGFNKAEIVGLAGYRLQDNLLYGRFIYVDDLVVSESMRRSGLGASLLDAVRRDGNALKCRHLVLDTGLHMALAQRFYFRQGLLARGMHFVEPLMQG